MAHIRIGDLRVERTLDARAMERVRGGDGAAWCFGWIQAYLPPASRPLPVINFYQINNFADQMINQFQTVSVSNSAPNAVVTVGVDERSINNGHV
ncbi:hypothetical protein IA69_21255 [Massilia sp. JS1662]|nr:hypothetical protein [Massilia sp. JS1662]KGF79951.1 hypothetical protein IA69_21255 [Massilia sp. JS1662]